MQPSGTNTDALAIDKLVKAGGAGWANNPSGTGSILVERATGCVIQSSNGQPITGTQRTQFPTVRFDKGKFRAHVDFFEGVEQYMYLDHEGNVTVGIGHLIKDVAKAEELPFYRRNSPKNPHPVHVANAFNLVLNSGRQGEEASKFKDLTHLDLDLTFIEQLFEDDVREFIHQIKHKDEFTQFDTFPALVQIGIVDLVYNMGMTRFYSKFTDFSAAAKVRNWVKVANESRRTEVDKKSGNLLENVRDRNNEVQKLFRQAIAAEPFFVNPGCPPKRLNFVS